MKFSLSWLSNYISLYIEASDLAEKLTMAGLEVETVAERYSYLETVVVGKIISIDAHPNADKLKLCSVDIGECQIPVVCGASNITSGMQAPVALPGTLFPDGSLLERSVIRGVTSEGMLCSEAELGLGADKAGIMTIESGVAIGDNLAKALNLSDKVFDVDITPNRPDCLSIVGIAREIAALYNTEINYPDTVISDTGNSISDLTSITIGAPDHCPRYTARLLDNIKVGPSPFWLQDRLLSIGLRPINNIVDITNFVLMETGQPLHAFDFDRLADKKIVVRMADNGEKFVTLDQNERALSNNMLMICDGRKPVALAGVMGGLNSEIEASTTRVLIESAYFNPAGIRRTAKKTGLNTEASHRFERGADPEGTINAANRAAMLMAEIGGGNIISGIIDEYPGPVRTKTLSLSVKDTNRLLGTSFVGDEIREMLESVEFKVQKDSDDILTVDAPSFRVDVIRPVDLMEEVARISGYNNIPTTFPMIPAEARRPVKQLEIRDRIKSIMNGFGFTESINYSFISDTSCDNLRLGPDDPRRRLVTILNPLTEDQSVMRTSLVPGLLESMHRNIAKQVKNLKLFEIGNIFISKGQDALPDEKEMLVALWTGKRFDMSWHSKEVECDFYDLKGILDGMLNGLQIDNISYTLMPDDMCRYTRPGFTAQILSEKDVLGLVGEVHPKVLQKYDLLQPTYIFEVELEGLFPRIPDYKQSEPIPKYPAVSRDITIIVDNAVESASILTSIKNTGEELVESLSIFDVFRGEPILPGEKSISFRIVYRSANETLEDERVNNIHKKITNGLLEKFNASFPAA